MLKSQAMTYPTVLRASEFPDQTAVVCGEASLTHAEFERRVIAAASGLRDHGVQPGDRIAVGAANSLEWVILIHAVTRAGATLVPLNTRLTAHEIGERLSLLAPILIFGDDEFLAKLPATALKRINIQSLADSGPERHGIGDTADPSVLCTIVSTSGTSGQAKGVCLTLANHLANAAASHQNLHCGQDDRWLINLPLFHVGGLAIVYRAALCGFAMVIHDDFSPKRTLEALRSEGITHLSLVEATLARILELNSDRPFPESVRAVLVGGGPVDASLLRQARELGLPVLPTYGLTEAASQVATMNPARQGTDFESGVPPLPSCDVEIRDSEGLGVSPDTEGEIWIRGPMVSSEYWMTGGKITLATKGGWLPTGDIGVMDPQGLLSVRGRKDDMIISGGENIHPAEVERALIRLPGIRRVAVLGIDDPQWGQIPVALVESDPGSESAGDDWLELLREQIAAYKLPKRIISVDRLPLTPIGKIDRSCLLEIYRRFRDDR